MNSQTGVSSVENSSPRGPLARGGVLRRIPWQQVGPLIALILLVIFFGSTAPQFFSAQNASLVLQQTMVTGVLAVAQTLIILTAGIDLACGSIMALTSMIIANLAVNGGLPVGVAILVGLAIGTGLGAISGLIIALINLPPFIVTLGMYNVTLALTYLYTHGETITGLPDFFTVLGTPFSVAGFPVTWVVIIALVVFVLGWIAVNQTRWGSRLTAIGDNTSAARLMGIPTSRLIIALYAFAGLIYAVAGVLLLGRTTIADPNVAGVENLNTITAVALGGTSLFGGRASIGGTFIGVLIVGVLANGLVLLGVDTVLQMLIVGILVIVAVAIDEINRRRAAS